MAALPSPWNMRNGVTLSTMARAPECAAQSARRWRRIGGRLGIGRIGLGQVVDQEGGGVRVEIGALVDHPVDREVPAVVVLVVLGDEVDAVAHAADALQD